MRLSGKTRYTALALQTLLLSILACAATRACAAPADLEPATRETDRAVSPETTRRLTAPARVPKKVSISVAPDDDPDAGTAAEEGFYVSSIVFSGMRSFSPGELSFITDRYTGREITSADMNALAREIEMEYLRRGIVSVVFVPPQDVTDGTLRLQVMEPDRP